MSGGIDSGSLSITALDRSLAAVNAANATLAHAEAVKAEADAVADKVESAAGKEVLDAAASATATARATAAELLTRLGVSGFRIEDAPEMLIGGVAYPIVVAYADGGLCGAVDEAGRFIPLTDAGGTTTEIAAPERFDGKSYALAFADESGNVLAGLRSDGKLVSEFPVTWPGMPLEEGSDPEWLLAFAYQGDEVAFGIRRDGSIFVPGAASASAGDLPGVSHIVGLGQSNEQGAQSTPVVSADDPGFGAYKFKRGIQTRLAGDNPATPELRADADFAFVPLRAEVQETWMGETCAVGLTSQLRTALTGGRFTAGDLSVSTPHYLFTYPHNGGKFLGDLDARNWEVTNPSNPFPGPGGYHAHFLDDVRRAKASATKAGLSYGVSLFHLTQGENEGEGRIDPSKPDLAHAAFVAAYKADFAAAYAGWDGGARAISGQRRPVPILVSQVSNHWAGQAQAQFANENPSAFLVGPIYYVPSALNSWWAGGQRGGAIHMSADGQRWRAEQAGKVARRILFEGEDWKPLQPVRVWRVSDSEIRVRFHVPRPPLRFETTWLADLVGKGFAVYLGAPDAVASASTRPAGAARAVTGCSIIADDTVAITLAAATPLPAGAAASVTYAESPVVGTTPAVKAVRPGAAYATGEASAEIVFAGDVRASCQFSKLLTEGCFILRQFVGGGASIIIRDVRIEGGDTVCRGESRSIVNGLLAGYGCAIERDRAFGNVCDSDPALSIFAFADPAYGTRQGRAYPLSNFAINFLWAVES